MSKTKQPEPLQNYIDAAGAMFEHADKDTIMDAARMFAAALLANEETKAGPRQREGSEAVAADIAKHGTPNEKFRRQVTAGEPPSDDEINTATALSDLAGSVNQERHFNNEPEAFGNIFDTDDVLDKIAAAIVERRRR